jgi:hypothetical protein
MKHEIRCPSSHNKNNIDNMTLTYNVTLLDLYRKVVMLIRCNTLMFHNVNVLNSYITYIIRICFPAFML